MHTRNVSTIFRKELKDTLRDRRTMIFAFLVPVVSMPLLMMLIFKIQMGAVKKLEEARSDVVVQGLDRLPQELTDSLNASPFLIVKTEQDYSGKVLIDELKQGGFQLLVLVPEHFADAIRLESHTDLEVYFDKAEERSAVALGKLQNILRDYRDGLVLQRVAVRNISPEVLDPFTVAENSVATAQKMAGKGLGGLIPYFLILTCFLGAMSPAVDLGAGEKERGTIETLMVAPATRGEFVIGKYAVVVLTGVISGLMSLASMTLSFRYMSQGEAMRRMSELLAVQFDFQTVLLILMVVIPLAGIFAAVLLSLSIFAKSAKEAQGYVGFMQFFLVLPAFAAVVPGVQLNFQLALIPVVNISLIIKNAIAGTIQWTYVLTAFFSTFAVAAITLYVAKKLFEREEVLFRM